MKENWNKVESDWSTQYTKHVNLENHSKYDSLDFLIRVPVQSERDLFYQSIITLEVIKTSKAFPKEGVYHLRSKKEKYTYEFFDNEKTVFDFAEKIINEELANVIEAIPRGSHFEYKE